MNYMDGQPVTADDKELIDIEVTGAICKILSNNKKEQEICQEMKESALIGNIDINSLKNHVKMMKDDK